MTASVPAEPDRVVARGQQSLEGPLQRRLGVEGPGYGTPAQPGASSVLMMMSTDSQVDFSEGRAKKMVSWRISAGVGLPFRPVIQPLAVGGYSVPGSLSCDRTVPGARCGRNSLLCDGGHVYHRRFVLPFQEPCLTVRFTSLDGVLVGADGDEVHVGVGAGGRRRPGSPSRMTSAGRSRSCISRATAKPTGSGAPPLGLALGRSRVMVFLRRTSSFAHHSVSVAASYSPSAENVRVSDSPISIPTTSSFAMSTRMMRLLMPDAMMLNVPERYSLLPSSEGSKPTTGRLPW